VVDANIHEVLNTTKLARPWAITFLPDGKYLSAANGLSNGVSAVDLVPEDADAAVCQLSSPRPT